jgi:Rad3-related DNA helicase
MTAVEADSLLSRLELPAKFDRGLRPHQVQALGEIIDAFDQGARVVFLDAPTGSGKTVLGEATRQILGARALYVCSDRGLQDQFVADFDYAKVLKGRANYPTELRRERTAEDCTAATAQSKCMYCTSRPACPYQVAKAEAAMADVAVLNTAYLLAAANGKDSPFSGWDLCILDEADVLESSLMGYVQFSVNERVLRMIGMDPPKKSVRKPTWVAWLHEFDKTLRDHVNTYATTMQAKEIKRLRQLATEAQRVAKEVEAELAAREVEDAESEDQGRWIRDYDGNGERGFQLRPVMVARYGPRFLWRHARRFLVMSATIISSDAMAEDLGLPLDYETVKVPMTFPVENRPVILAPVADVTYKTQDAAIPKLAHAITRILEEHLNERVLVHCVSFKLAHELMNQVSTLMTHDRHLVTHASKGKGLTREEALAQYRRHEGAVLFSAGMERGVDLKDDDCRVQIIAKMPFEALGDKVTSARLHLPGGQVWYAIQNVRKLVQMTGRGVRSADDYAVTYILDGQFGRVWRKDRTLFPEWWQEAVDTGADIRWLLS